eukprot:354411-Chlamydomonas_euryale.AAC.23
MQPLYPLAPVQYMSRTRLRHAQVRRALGFPRPALDGLAGSWAWPASGPAVRTCNMCTPPAVDGAVGSRVDTAENGRLYAGGVMSPGAGPGVNSPAANAGAPAASA